MTTTVAEYDSISVLYDDHCTLYDGASDMGGIATVTVTATLTGGNTNDKQYGPVPFANTCANEETTNVVVGPNTVVDIPTTPSQAIGVVISPPTNNTTQLVLKGSIGDIGLTISPSSPTFIPFGTPYPTSFVISAPTDPTVNVLLWWV